ncbi:hypothetical protein IQ260_23170 [Leptolyngbya cf. ectocarpi LEGE 11479]|uniref:Uncharacterized protein n=1 Tax=Leptolyngbya cf. ectocarpi LEGE 11479 TaxID=1828722 RepID=A0A928ZY08_LEPEC|nr:hypothetical protein [Leptolyngbya ectocarpi]MBE9069551.1 hypothetical protein [Leptolyngbya cf. ectocarpi LEGE 11479]
MSLKSFYNLCQRTAVIGFTGLSMLTAMEGIVSRSVAAQLAVAEPVIPEYLQLSILEEGNLTVNPDINKDETTLEQFLIHFNDAYLVYEPDQPGLQIAAQQNVLSYGLDWEIVQLKPYLYAFRQRNWQNFYWKVNTSRQEVYRVTNGTFGELGGDEELMEMSVDNVGSPESPDRFFLRFQDAYLVKAQDGVLQIATEQNVLSYGGDWQVVELKPYLFQLKQDVWQGFHWQVNTSRQIAERINGETFGQLGGDSRESLAVEIEAVY